jgi:hypothetical protein
MDHARAPGFNDDMEQKRAITLCAVLMFGAACDNPASPSADLRGEWDFTFAAFDQRSCPVPAGLVPGCAGSGLLGFPAGGPGEATHSYRASCQSCGGAAEYGVVEQPLRTARLSGDVLEFTLAACRFTATVLPGATRTIAGSATCRPDLAGGPEVIGEWIMSRR